MNRWHANDFCRSCEHDEENETGLYLLCTFLDLDDLSCIEIGSLRRFIGSLKFFLAQLKMGKLWYHNGPP